MSVLFYFSHSDSKLTQLLEEALGGNSKTRVIFCLSSTSDSQHLAAVLKTCIALLQDKNFPVLNGYFVEVQFRSQIPRFWPQLDLFWKESKHLIGLGSRTLNINGCLNCNIYVSMMVGFIVHRSLG